MSHIFQEAMDDLVELRAKQGPSTGNGNGHTAPHLEIRPLPLVTFRELAARPRDKMRFLIGEHLPAKETTLISGRERSFKSFLTMEWATSLALGRPAFGQFAVGEPGTVLLFDLENRPPRLCDRVEAKLARDDLQIDDFDDRLIVFDRDNAPDRWRFDAVSLAGLTQAIEVYRPALVVVDNVRKATPPGRDEKDSKDMLPIVDALVDTCEQGGTALVLVHHDRRDGTGFSGSGVLASSPANYIQVKRDRQTGIAVIHCDSMRNAEPFADFAAVMGKDGALRLTDVPEQTDEDKRPDHSGPIMDALRQGALTIAEIVATTGLTDRQVRPVVKRLVAAEMVIDVGERKSWTGTPATAFGLAR